MTGAKMRILLVSRVPKGRGDRAPSAGQQGSPQQGQQLPPGGGGKHTRERVEQGDRVILGSVHGMRVLLGKTTAL
jgi:hypothetical protein